MKSLRVLIGFILWLFPFFLVKVPLIIIGIPYVWVALKLNLPLLVWGGPGPFPAYTGSDWYWYAIRNPVQGLKFPTPGVPERYAEPDVTPLERPQLEAIGETIGCEVLLLGPLSWVRLLVINEQPVRLLWWTFEPGYFEFAIGFQMFEKTDIDLQARHTTGRD
jgi:hypothetical protein